MIDLILTQGPDPAVVPGHVQDHLAAHRAGGLGRGIGSGADGGIELHLTGEGAVGEAHGEHRHRTVVRRQGGIHDKAAGQAHLHLGLELAVVHRDHALITALLGHRHHPALPVYIGGEHLFVLRQLQGKGLLPVPAGQQSLAAGIVGQSGGPGGYRNRVFHGDCAVHIHLTTG